MVPEKLKPKITAMKSIQSNFHMLKHDRLFHENNPHQKNAQNVNRPLRLMPVKQHTGAEAFPFFISVSIKMSHDAGIRHNHRALLWFQGIGGGAIQQAFCKFGPNFIACPDILVR